MLDADTLQRKVLHATGVPVAQQRLEFGGRLLRPGRKLTSYGVQHGSELILKKEGGGAVVTRQGEQMTKVRFPTDSGRFWTGFGLCLADFDRMLTQRREIKAVKGRQSI